MGSFVAKKVLKALAKAVVKIKPKASVKKAKKKKPMARKKKAKKFNPKTDPAIKAARAKAAKNIKQTRSMNKMIKSSKKILSK